MNLPPSAQQITNPSDLCHTYSRSSYRTCDIISTIHRTTEVQASNHQTAKKQDINLYHEDQE
jgi:hypothetical protein